MEKVDGLLKLYRSTLDLAEDKLQPSRNRFGKVTKRFVWYFQRGEFAEILAKIGRIKADFNALLNLYLPPRGHY